MSFTGKNPRFSSAILTDIVAATPSNPIAGSSKIINRNGVLFTRNSGGTEAQYATTALATAAAAGLVTSYDATIASNQKAVASAAYTILANDGFRYINVTTGASNRVITLPAVASSGGRKLVIKKVDNGAGFVTINSAETNNIESLTTLSLYAIWDSLVLYSDATNWYIEAINQTVYLEANAASNAASTTVPFKYTSITDTASAYSATTGVFIVPTGFYGVLAINAVGYSGGNFDICIYINGTFKKQGTQATNTTGGIVTHSLRVNAGDTIEIRPDTNATANGTATINYLSIAKVSCGL